MDTLDRQHVCDSHAETKNGKNISLDKYDLFIGEYHLAKTPLVADGIRLAIHFV